MLNESGADAVEQSLSYDQFLRTYFTFTREGGYSHSNINNV